MLELFVCSLLTIMPDFLYRRFVQGKRLGREINIFSVWYELRWGITSCLLLTTLLITMVFFFHPSTRSAVAYFRTVPLLSEGIGRVDKVHVGIGDRVKQGEPLFELDSAKQDAAVESARRRVAEVDASFKQAEAELMAADGRLQEAQSSLLQAQEELAVRTELIQREPATVARREIERLQRVVEGRVGGVSAAEANKQAVQTQISTLLPAQKASAEAALAQAQVELDKMTVYAGVDGILEQFTLRVGDIVNPMMRPAGVLIPADAGRRAIIAGFGQIEAGVMKVGMVGEVTCIAKPLVIIPVVVTEVQDVIAAGQIRPTDVLLDPTQATRPGAITAFLEPLYKGGFDGIPPGGHCIANAYTSNHELLQDPSLGAGRRAFLHAIDTIGVVHAMILRIQALLLPIQTLVLGGH